MCTYFASKGESLSLNVSKITDAKGKPPCPRFNASAVHYRIVELKLLKGSAIWTVGNTHTLPLYPYPAMATDVAQVANELSRWIYTMGLEEYRLEEKRAA